MFGDNSTVETMYYRDSFSSKLLHDLDRWHLKRWSGGRHNERKCFNAVCSTQQDGLSNLSTTWGVDTHLGTWGDLGSLRTPQHSGAQTELCTEFWDKLLQDEHDIEMSMSQARDQRTTRKWCSNRGQTWIYA
eukprot:15364804-Ditylum_brightwellii.AAC.2